MAFEVFDYGNVLKDAESIMKMREARNPNSTANQLQRQQLTNAQQNNAFAQSAEQRAAAKAARDEAAAGAITPEKRDEAIWRVTDIVQNPGTFGNHGQWLVQNQFLPPEILQQQQAPDQIKLGANNLLDRLNAHKASTVKSKETGKINLSDFTAASVAKYETTGDKNDLVRYVKPLNKVQKINGVWNIVTKNNVTGEHEAIPLSNIKSESEAKRLLEEAGETGKQDVLDERLPARAEETEKRKVIGKHGGQIEVDKPKKLMAMKVVKEKVKQLDNLITKAKSKASNWTTGFMGSKLKDTPGTPAHDLSLDLLTIRSNAGLDAIRDMKASGATLGQVTEAEWPRLESKWSALEQSASKQAFIKNLDEFNKQQKISWKLIQEAHEGIYGEPYDMATGQTPPAQPVQPSGGWSIESID